jgi:hypothetical protein
VPQLLQPGDALARVALEDQNGIPRLVDSSTRIVVFTRDMSGGEIVKQAFAGLRSAALEANHVACVCDVSGMPWLVRSMFALPGLRKRLYPVMLDESGEATRAFPYREGKASILVLDSGIIASVAYAGTGDEVTAALRL